MKRIHVLSQDEVRTAVERFVHVELEIRPGNIETMVFYANTGEGFRPLATTEGLEVRITDSEKD